MKGNLNQAWEIRNKFLKQSPSMGLLGNIHGKYNGNLGKISKKNKLCFSSGKIPRGNVYEAQWHSDDNNSFS